MQKLKKSVCNLFNKVPVVTVLPLRGVILAQSRSNTAFSDSTIAESIEKAFKPKNLSAVALAINCPGGSPAQSNMILQRIRKHAKDRDVPVIAFCEDVAASGGYMLACAADEIYVDENAILGSIGVISASFGAKDLLDKVGLERRLYTSGSKKSMLDPFLPTQEDDVTRLKDIQKQIHTQFIELVKSRRGSKLKTETPSLFEGDIWIGQRAVEVGLADATGHLFHVLEEKFGKSVDVRQIEVSTSLWKKLGLSSQQHMPEMMLDAIEQKTHWNRFGF